MSLQVPGEDPALDAETRVPTLIGTSIAFCIAASLVVMLRMYTRHFIVRSPGSDDYTMGIAAILAIGVAVCTILQAQHGLGLHLWMAPKDPNFVQLKSLFASEIFYNLSQIMIKISFLLQYRRIFRDTVTRAVCFWLILYLVGWGITQAFLVAFACIPVSIFVPGLADKCIYSLTVWYLTSIMNIVSDFVIFLVPIPAVRNLSLPVRQKFLVMSLFCLGFFTCIISIVRLFTLRAALNSADTTWDNAPTSWWTTIELNCGIMASSIATLRPLIRKFAPGSSAAATGADGSYANNTIGARSGVHGGSKAFKSGAGYHRHSSPQNDADDAASVVGGAFPMGHMHMSNESQNGLKEDVSDVADGSQVSYDYAEASRHL